MEPNIAENIRAFRKEKKLTQEQLAEAMGVTTGAVHKWETGLSTPELSMVMELADFFDISVDVLLGYKVRDNREETIVKRLAEYCKTRDPRAITEVEKALQKYPNSFETVYACAVVYQVFGVGGKHEKEVRRSLELFERALTLLPQNKDPEVGEQSIYGGIASSYELLGEYDRSLEILKQHNQYGIFNDDIGLGLAFFRQQYSEAEPYLSKSLINCFLKMTNTVFGLSLVLGTKGDYASALDITEWQQNNIKMFRKGKKTGFLDKVEAMTLVARSYIYLKMEKRKDAMDCMRKAHQIVTCFDMAPSFCGSDFRFVNISSETSFHDGLGTSAGESIENMLGVLDSSELIQLWRNVHENGN
jgi:transcriptional regulator with XRE-family HTH domain